MKKVKNLLREYMGAIFLFITLFCSITYYINEIDKINEQQANQTSIVNIVEEG